MSCGGGWVCCGNPVTGFRNHRSILAFCWVVLMCDRRRLWILFSFCTAPTMSGSLWTTVTWNTPIPPLQPSRKWLSSLPSLRPTTLSSRWCWNRPLLERFRCRCPSGSGSVRREFSHTCRRAECWVCCRLFQQGFFSLEISCFCSCCFPHIFLQPLQIQGKAKSEMNSVQMWKWQCVTLQKPSGQRTCVIATHLGKDV